MQQIKYVVRLSAGLYWLRFWWYHNFRIICLDQLIVEPTIK